MGSLCNTVAEVQGFRSAWLGLANVVLAWFLFVSGMLFLIFGVILLTRM
jgi:hypothetical protein